MKFYHRTKKERWDSIQKEGVLWGLPHSSSSWKKAESQKNNWDGYPRYTYLSPTPWEWDDKSYGDIILEVELNLFDKTIRHNYGFNPPPGQYCFQFSVFTPIPLLYVKQIFDLKEYEYLRGQKIQYEKTN
jgi:hypothetical protein